MTFGELQRAVFDDFQYQAAPKPGVQDRVRRYLNEGLERVLRRPRLKTLRFATFGLTTTPGQGFYGAPMTLERIDDIIDLTNGRRLGFKTRDWYRSLDPGVTVTTGPNTATIQTARTTGTPSVWIAEGIGPMRRYPLPAPDGYVYLWAIAGPGDTTQTLVMDATFFYGDTYRTYTKLTGAAPVQLNVQGMPPGTQITTLTLDSTCATYVHVQDVGTLTPSEFQLHQVAVIDQGEFSSRHLGLRLYPTPSAALPYEIEGLRAIPKMRIDMDEPPFHDSFHEMLACYARARLYRKDGRLQQAGAEMGEFERFAIDLTAYVEFPPGYRPVAGKYAQGSRFSDLGPWYPADRLIE